MSSLQKRVLVSKLPPRLPMGPGSARGGQGARGRRDYTPLHFASYFHSSFDITVDKGEQGKNTFCVYEIGSGSGPAVFMLHGGGFSGLTWALTSQVLNSLISCRIFAMDLRGHGSSTTIDDGDLSALTLSSDIIDIIEAVVQKFNAESSDVVLVGHSMGGALAVHAALSERPISNLVGVCVIDVVEGTAMDALASMQSFLRSRPSKFKSMDQAIEWCVRSGQVRNNESARVSMPGQLRNTSTGQSATKEISQESKEPTSPTAEKQGLPINENTIAEEESEGDEDEKPVEKKPFKSPTEDNATAASYSWRIDLAKTEPFWRGWFEGLSEKFLSVPASKLLLLAGVDRLDRDLTVGQMQGKFQMQILPQAGHAVHEDVPERVAEVLASFLVRNKFAEPLAAFTPAMPGC